MIAVYRTIPAEEIKANAEAAILQIEEWFKNNPRRRICRTAVWYGKSIKIKRGKVRETLESAVKEAIGNKK